MAIEDKKRKEIIGVGAYYLAQKGYTYDDLCWMLAEKQLFPEDPSEDALKFFITWISQCIEVGGPNLPKTISTLLGSKLAKIYKQRGINSFEKALKTSYGVLKGAADIVKKDENTFDVKVKYAKNFCPIGGKYDPNKAELFQKSICTPFTMGFLNAVDTKYKYEGEIHECILNSTGCMCQYTLHLEEKESNNNK